VEVRGNLDWNDNSENCLSAGFDYTEDATFHPTLDLDFYFSGI
jgi:hypothetical protein